MTINSIDGWPKQLRKQGDQYIIYTHIVYTYPNDVKKLLIKVYLSSWRNQETYTHEYIHLIDVETLCKK